MENDFKPRLIIYFAVMGLFLLILAFTTHYIFYSIQKQFNEVEDITEQIHHIHELELLLEKAVMPANDYIITGDIKYRNAFDNFSKKVEDSLLRQKERVIKEIDSHSIKEMAVLKEIEGKWNKIKIISLEIMNIPDPFGNKRAAALMEEMDYSLKDPIVEMLRDMGKWHRDKLKIARQSVDRFRKQGSYIFLTIFIVIIAIAIFYSLNALRIYSKREAERDYLFMEVEKSKKDWEHTFDAIKDLVSIHDKDFRFVKVNKALCEKFKMTPQELIGKKCYEIFHQTHSPHPFCPHKKTIESGEFAFSEVSDPNMGGTFILSTSPIFDVKGEFFASVHIARDVTKERQLQMQFIQAEKLATIGTLVSGAVHEISNPLTGVIGYSELLLAKDLDADTKNGLHVIHSEASRAAKVSRNLLSFAREHKPMKSMIDVHDIIEKTISLRAYELKVNNIRLVKDYSTYPIFAYADPNQLQQVFLNIIVNAEQEMTASHGRGELIIKTESAHDRGNGHIKVTIHDDGRGISTENLSRIFEPFFTTKPVGKGTGLGLSLSFNIIKDHGGKLYAESQSGKGAKFVIELPVKEREKS
ncbi:MAG: PAS domain-containing protein [Nitrospinae bacterium]|nr:PAS domain-containing protein [Nitrospinota bacterium]